MRKDIIFFISLLLCVGCSSGSNYEKQFSKILDYEACKGCFTDEQFDEVFGIIEGDSRTFEHDFSYVDHMRIIESNDGNVRAYIMENQGFGGNPTWGFYTAALIQYRIGDSVYTYRMPDANSVIEKILRLSDKQYLFISYNGTISYRGQYDYNRAVVYHLDESGAYQLADVFEKDDYYDDEIEVYWNGKVCPDDESELISTEGYDEDNIEDKLYYGIFFNKFDGTLYVANTKVFEENQYGKLMVLDGTFRCYCWTGDTFRDVTIMKPYEVKNKDYYIRIEQRKDGSCTYKCWNGGIRSGEPNLTIYGGTRERLHELGFMNYDEWISLDEYQPLGERYTFTNNGYVYQYMTGWDKGHMYEDLNVYNPNGTLIYSKDFDIVSQNENK